MRRRALTPDDMEIIRQHYFEPDGVRICVEETGHARSTITGWANRQGWFLHRRQIKTTEHKDRHSERPQFLPLAVAKTGKCLGIGNGPCGKGFRPEEAHETEGFTRTGSWTVVCWAGHRFQLP